MPDRRAQLEYSELQPLMHDVEGRRRKADKIGAILCHFLGRTRLDGLRLLDLGASTGYIAESLHARGAHVVGADIDTPGLQAARSRLPESIALLGADGTHLPLATATMDIAIFNHTYEHVLAPEAVLAEIRRVLRPGGIVYLGLANRWFPIEPHYKLPGLSWLPPHAADRYLQITGRGERYHERLKSPRELRDLTRGLTRWDYTETVLSEPDRFAATDLVPAPLRALPPTAWRLARGILPTYLWIGSTDSEASPAGPSVLVAPRRVPS